MDNSKITNDERLSVCNYLVQKGANVNAYNKQDITPIHLAAKLQHNEILELFLKYGGNGNILDGNQQNALHHALIPQISFCPSFSPSKMIPEPEVKYRDINKISRALWQQLNDFFKIGNFANLSTIDPTTNVATNNEDPLLYPLLAIKNIIGNSDKYLDIKANKSLIPVEKTFFEKKNDETRNKLKEILVKPETSTKDKQFKTKELIASLKNEIVGELNNYFKGAKDDLTFGKDNAFLQDDLKYFDEDPSKEVIFASREQNYKKFFDDMLLKLDEEYVKEVDEIVKKTKKINDNLEKLDTIINELHDFNLFYSTAGGHQNLTEDNVEKYNEIYQLDIPDKDTNYPAGLLDREAAALRFYNGSTIKVIAIKDDTLYGGQGGFKFDLDFLGTIWIPKLKDPPIGNIDPLYVGVDIKDNEQLEILTNINYDDPITFIMLKLN